ncbi:MAG TPA: hypothetical protein VGK19_18120 [Capsulimonadaceae bacterium]
MPFYVYEADGQRGIRFTMDIDKDGRCFEFERYCDTGKVTVFAPDGKQVSDDVAERVAEMFGSFLEGGYPPQDMPTD